MDSQFLDRRAAANREPAEAAAPQHLPERAVRPEAEAVRPEAEAVRRAAQAGAVRPAAQAEAVRREGEAEHHRPPVTSAGTYGV